MLRMAAPGSVTYWLQQLTAGDRGTVERLWQRYYPRLVGLARSRLQGLPALQSDAEDVALSAFDNFCRGAEGGRFPDLNDRDDLWQLLVVLTARKATDRVRHALREKRGGGRVHTLSAPLGDPDTVGPLFAELIARDPDPQFAAAAAEEYRRLLASLDDPVLRAVAVGKMEGFTNGELARRLSLSVPTVERKLRLIRKVWEGEAPP
jgi:DNA-directed RNA polymerase specialized sigma24 family protein